MEVRTPTSIARALLSGAFDDASLFPPAAAPMEAALGLHATSGRSPWSLARGRLLVPAAALPTVVTERRLLGLTDQLELGVVVGSPADPTAGSPLADVGRLATAAMADDPGVHVRHVEYRPGEQSPDGVARAGVELGRLGDDLGLVAVHLEVAGGADVLPELVAAVADVRRDDDRVHAKLRFGGVTPELFPTDDAVLAFLRAAVRHEVPFKGTAGLHHAWYRGGDDPHHGYLAVLLAVVALLDGADDTVVREHLNRPDGRDVRLTDDRLLVPGLAADVAVVARARRHFVGFGTCSFTEPLAAFLALPGATAGETDP